MGMVEVFFDKDKYIKDKRVLCKDTHIQCVPPKTTAQQKGVFVRDGRAHFFVKGKVKQMQQSWFELLQEFRKQIAEPLSGAIKIYILIIYPHKKSTPKKLQDKIIPHISRPDGDNIEKGLFDTMSTMAFWTDDSRIFSHQTEKYWGPEPSITIILEEFKV